MKKLDFLIFYEGLNRELESLTLLKMELERRGYSVAISHYSRHGYGHYVRNTLPSVIIVPWLRFDFNVYTYTRFKKSTYKLVDLQWEQVYNKEGVDSDITTVHGEAKKGYHLCWGENSFNRLEQKGVPRDNLFITGALQLDFCRQDFSGYYKSKLEIANQYGLNPQRKWSLFISSFASVPLSKEELRVTVFENNSYDKQKKKLVDDTQAAIFLWFEQFVVMYPSCEFIYRPHPVEIANQRLKELAASYPNFHVIFEEPIKQWISVSDNIYTWASTSIAEIYYMKKQCYILRPIELPSNFEMEVLYGASCITDKEAFLRTGGETNDLVDFPVSAHTFSQYYSVDEKPSYYKTADVLEQILREGTPVKYELKKSQLKDFRKDSRFAISSSLLIDLIERFHLEFLIPARRDKVRKFVALHFGLDKKIEAIEEKLKKIGQPHS